MICAQYDEMHYPSQRRPARRSWCQPLELIRSLSRDSNLDRSLMSHQKPWRQIRAASSPHGTRYGPHLSTLGTSSQAGSKFADHREYQARPAAFDHQAHRNRIQPLARDANTRTVSNAQGKPPSSEFTPMMFQTELANKQGCIGRGRKAYPTTGLEQPP